jgi:hypothetical protein
MTDEWLRADQVAAIAARHDGFAGCGGALGWLYALRGDTKAAAAQLEDDRVDLAALCTQDGRWRALVGALLPHVRHAAGCDLALPACQCGALTAIARGLAALAGTPPPTRGAAE